MTPKDIFKLGFGMYLCKMCENKVEQEDTDCIGDCGHNYCNNCLNKYCIYKISVNEDVICP